MWQTGQITRKLVLYLRTGVCLKKVECNERMSVRANINNGCVMT